MKVKIFVGSDVNRVESEVNKWLSGNSKIRVLNALQSESSDAEHEWSMTITIFYDDGKKGTAGVWGK